ncbi:MAG TPA: TonB-dependent receptor [Thermoanaerobaculia bacterium]
MRAAHRPALYLLVLCFSVSVSLLAQSSGGSITGTVSDESGAFLPGVTITATDGEKGTVRTAVTNERGAFALPLVPVGTYDVTAELGGFRPARRASVVVNIGSSVHLPLTLRVGVEQSVTVTADAPLIETTRTQVSAVVNEKLVENLPTNGRNFIDFVLTTPGVVKDTRQGDLSFAGQRGTLNSLVVDGADNNNTFFGQALGRTGSGRAPYQFSQDAVQEFQINTNAYSAEYGRAGGAVINVVTKSGTNQVDGSAFWFLRDRDFNANDYINVINNRPKGPYEYDQYGFSLGGPIVRDRHFYFVNWDAQRNSVANTVIMNLAGTTPADAVTQAGLERLRALALDYERGQNQDVYLAKTDSELGANSHLALRFNRQEFTGVNFENGGPTNAFEHTGDSLVNTDTFTASWVRAFGGSVFNDVRAQYAKDQEPGKANSANPEATVRQNGQTVLTIGRNFFSPRETTIERYQLADTVTFLFGDHTLKAGFDLNKDDILNYFPGNFSGAYTFNSIASFQNGRPTGSGERYVQAFAGPGTTGPITNPNLFETALFVQDEWRLRPTLTVNAGVRYDRAAIEQPDVRNPDAQLAAAGIDTSKVPEDDDNVGLRLGAAWQPGFSPRSVVRAGFGTFYGRTPAIMIGTAHSNNGINVQTITFTGDLVPTYPNTLPGIPAGVTLPKPTIFVFDRDYENPTVHQASLGFEHPLTETLAFGVTLQHVEGENLSRATDINIQNPETVEIPIQGGGTAAYKRYATTRPFANFDRIIEFQSSASSQYDGITLDFIRRFSGNWQARLSYTYANAEDDRPDATAVVPQSSDDAKFAQDPFDLDGDWGPADADVEHRAVLSGVWDLDAYAADLGAWQRAIFGGWALSGIVSYQSGQPYSALIGTDLNRDGNNRNDRAPGFGRNTFRYDDQFSIDPRVTKTFLVRGDARVQLIAEAFNVTNEDNVSGVRTTYYSLASGQLVRQSNFGSPTVSSGPRIVQFAAKIIW